MKTDNRKADAPLLKKKDWKDWINNTDSYTREFKKPNFLQRINQGFRYIRTGYLPKKETRLIYDFINVSDYNPSNYKLFSKDFSEKQIALLTQFTVEIEAVVEYDLELWKTDPTTLKAIHFLNLIDNPYKDTH